MDNPGSGPSQTPPPRRLPVLFSPQEPQPPNNAQKSERNWLPWTIAVVTIGCLVGLGFWFGRITSTANNARTNLYAKYLVVRDLHVSRADNFAGDSLVYVDGTLENRGKRAVTSLEMQAFFSNDAGDPPRMAQAPVALIRSRQPYVETEPLSRDPLLPGESRDFRLTFANVSSIWNEKIPRLQVLRAETQP